jgi:hypothetical protein
MKGTMFVLKKDDCNGNDESFTTYEDACDALIRYVVDSNFSKMTHIDVVGYDTIYTDGVNKRQKRCGVIEPETTLNGVHLVFKDIMHKEDYTKQHVVENPKLLYNGLVSC